MFDGPEHYGLKVQILLLSRKPTVVTQIGD
jgi:hypothetical protein